MSFIYAYNELSQAAKRLSRALAWPRIKHHGSRFNGRHNPWVLNWGNETLPMTVLSCRLINTPDAVAEISDKVLFFDKMAPLGDFTPNFCKNINEATRWMEDTETSLVCRTLRKGHSGAGIVMADTVDQLVPAPLYTQYIKKSEEYRVHVFDGQVIDIQQKRRKLNVPDDEVNWRVRNIAGGFIYARENITLHPSAMEIALECMTHTGLDFGAVDVIWNHHQSRAYVLEINSAPGLEGQTLTSYVNALRNFTN